MMTLPVVPVGRMTARQTTAAARPLMMQPSLGAVQNGVAGLPDTPQNYRAGLQVFR